MPTNKNKKKGYWGAWCPKCEKQMGLMDRIDTECSVCGTILTE